MVHKFKLILNIALEYGSSLHGRTCKFLLYLLISYSFMFVSNDAWSQDLPLSLEEAITITLENNFDVRISKNDAAQLELQNHPGQAGMLPELSLNASYSRADNNTKQKYSNGDQIDRNHAISENTNADATLEWTIFDGLKMFSTKKKLSMLSSQGHLALKMEMENVLVQVIQAYYEISRQQQLLRSIKEEIALGKERLAITERRFSNGSGSKLDVLHAKTDLNARLNAEMKGGSELAAARMELNKIMARPLETAVIVNDSINISYKPSLEELKKKSDESNNIKSYYRQQLIIAELELKESSAMRWPTIKLNAKYLFSNTQNDAGFILLNRNQGLNYGATATLPLFSGFNISRSVKSARMDVINSRLNKEQTEQKVDAEILLAYRNYTDQLSILNLEEENILASREILSISQERFRTGVSNILELKEVQRNYEEDMNRYVDAKFYSKMAEVKLKHLAGDLIK